MKWHWYIFNLCFWLCFQWQWSLISIHVKLRYFLLHFDQHVLRLNWDFKKALLFSFGFIPFLIEKLARFVGLIYRERRLRGFTFVVNKNMGLVRDRLRKGFVLFLRSMLAQHGRCSEFSVSIMGRKSKARKGLTIPRLAFEEYESIGSQPPQVKQDSHFVFSYVFSLVRLTVLKFELFRAL